MQTYVWLLAAGVVLTSVTYTDGCSCAMVHPQEQYCKSDFVILARVKREFILNETRIYKTRIRKEYKMTDKARVALKSGRILTESEDSVCGVSLKIGKLYAIAGKVVTLKAKINLCGLNERWEDLSKRQRKGLRRMYSHGCTCGINECYRNRRCARTRDACNWITANPDMKKDCQRREGICLRSKSKQCVWAKNVAEVACLKNSTLSSKIYSPFRDGPGKMFVQ